MYVDKLTTFEQAEILDFPEVWFLGLDGKKIEGVPGAPTNNGMVHYNQNDLFVAAGSFPSSPTSAVSHPILPSVAIIISSFIVFIPIISILCMGMFYLPLRAISCPQSMQSRIKLIALYTKVADFPAPCQEMDYPNPTLLQ